MQSIDRYFGSSSSNKKRRKNGLSGSSKRSKVESDLATGDVSLNDVIENDGKSDGSCDSHSSYDSNMRQLKSVNLDLDYGIIFRKSTADMLFRALEKEIEYDPMTQVKIYGKVYDVKRKVTCYGDVGLTYMYSGVLNKAKPWPKSIQDIKERVETVAKKQFNFVLVNRYDNGLQYMGEHRDDEKDLDHSFPIASVSFGQHRDFTFRHKDSRGKGKTGPSNIKILLEHGSLLLMNPPTNQDWYHSLPKRSISVAPGVRINLTFRRILVK